MSDRVLRSLDFWTGLKLPHFPWNAKELRGVGSKGRGLHEDLSDDGVDIIEIIEV